MMSSGMRQMISIFFFPNDEQWYISKKKKKNPILELGCFSPSIVSTRKQ